jgi:hypothetical protein
MIPVKYNTINERNLSSFWKKPGAEGGRDGQEKKNVV